MATLAPSLLKSDFIAIDLFSGAGGMSIGAASVGIHVKYAVEIDKYAAQTYSANHRHVKLYNDDIRKLKSTELSDLDRKSVKLLFGGPPCKGFSTSNQKTRTKGNESNWLFKEYLRIAKVVRPDWVIVENVKGILETEKGFFFERIQDELKTLGYTTNSSVLNAADFGVPQIRNRMFIIGSLHGTTFKFPKPTHKNHITVNDAISDLPDLASGADFEELDYKQQSQNAYQRSCRNRSKKAINNLVTGNNRTVLERYKHIPQGGNWQNIPPKLMMNYKDFSRCHTGIYHRLKANSPSIVIGNYRKNMLIHPFQDRGLSVREAARIQSFPDSFKFFGSIGFQQEQVGNSVPPLLAKAIFKEIIKQ